MSLDRRDDSSLLIAEAEQVPEDFREVFLEIVTLTDGFCRRHLNADYQEVCREMAVALCQPGSPVKRGKRESWASGVVYTVGWVNFLGDPAQDPHMRSEDIAKGFEVSAGTMHAKSKELREGLDLMQLDPDFTLPSRVADNPLVWMAEVNGMLVDLRDMPREIQQAACEQGVIPYIPADGEPVEQKSLARPKRSRAPMPQRDLLMQFKITLKDTHPPVWRRIQIFDCTLDKLHQYIQAAFGWQDYHMHQFTINGACYGDPQVLIDDNVVDSCMTLLSELVSTSGKKKPRLLYEYDFGDSWIHEIVLEGLPQPEKRRTYPLCTEGERACPPEDCGGPWRYASFLHSLAEPEGDHDEEMLEWFGEFDPEDFDARAATKEMRRAK